MWQAGNSRFYRWLRAMLRDQNLFGSSEAVQARYLQRYFPGQRLYFQAANSLQRADVIVMNNNPVNPQLVFPGQISS